MNRSLFKYFITGAFFLSMFLLPMDFNTLSAGHGGGHGGGRGWHGGGGRGYNRGYDRGYNRGYNRAYNRSWNRGYYGVGVAVPGVVGVYGYGTAYPYSNYYYDNGAGVYYYVR